MFEIIEHTNDVGRRGFIVRNNDNGKDLGTYRFYDDALAHLKRLEQARMRRLRAANVKAAQEAA